MSGSPENSLYLNEHLHTGHLRHVSSELIKRAQDVVDFYIDEVTHVDPIPENCLSPLIIRKALSPGNLRKRTRESWITAEKHLARLLVNVRVLKNPVLADNKITRILLHLPEFHTTKEASVFLKSTFLRLDYLLSDRGQQRLDSLRFGGCAYVESRVLNLAIFTGIYLAKPNYN